MALSRYLCVERLPLAAGELQTRIRTEKDSPKADVFIGGSSEFHSPLGTEGLLLPYTSPNAANMAACRWRVRRLSLARLCNSASAPKP